jgi:hypothetical protein
MADGRTALAIVNPDGTAITPGSGTTTANGTVGSPTTTTASQAGFKDSAGNVALGNLDASGNLKVSGSFSPATAVDGLASGTLGALNASVVLPLNGYYGAGFNIPTGLVGTIQAFLSYDGGLTYPQQTEMYNATTGSFVLSLASPAGGYGISITGGASHLKIIVTAYTSGSATASLRATLAATPDLSAVTVTNLPTNQTVTVSNNVAVTSSVANNNWAQALATTIAATVTVINIASSVANYQVKGMICHGTGDGYFFVQVNAVTVFSGRTRATQPVLIISLPNGIPVTTGSSVALKVTNESGSTADFEATLLGA